MRYGVFDPAGMPQAFYWDEINLDIPENAVPLTEEQWRELVAYQGTRRWDGSRVVPFSPPVDLGAYAAAKRYDAETGGIVVAGMIVATDDRSKTLLAGARIKADSDVNHTVRFKTGAGFVTLDAAQIVTVSDAVLEHVQACFDAEGDILAAIGDGTVTTVAQIDEWPWPEGRNR